jgi:hypothetical protein
MSRFWLVAVALTASADRAIVAEAARPRDGISFGSDGFDAVATLEREAFQLGVGASSEAEVGPPGDDGVGHAFGIDDNDVRHATPTDLDVDRFEVELPHGWSCSPPAREHYLDAKAEIWYNAGWLGFFVLFSALVAMAILFLKRPRSRKEREEAENADELAYTLQLSGPRSCLGEVLLGASGIAGVVVEITALAIAGVNFALYAWCTELSFFSCNFDTMSGATQTKFNTIFKDGNPPELNPGGERFFFAHDLVEGCSLVFFVILFLLRVWVAHEDEAFDQFGPSGAWWRYLMMDHYAHFDILAILITACDLFLAYAMSPGEVRFNCLWLYLSRCVEVTSRRLGGIQFRGMKAAFAKERLFLCYVFAVCAVWWVVASGVLYSLQRDNRTFESVLVNVKSTGSWAGYNRFATMPSAMFYTLVQAVKEQPYPYMTMSPSARTASVILNFLATPIAALAVGGLGTIVLGQAMKEKRAAEAGGDADGADYDGDDDEEYYGYEDDEVEEDGEIPADEGAEVAEEEEPTPAASPEDIAHYIVKAIGTLLSFGSVFLYFYFTACESKRVPEKFQFISAKGLAIIDGVVGLAFFAEWMWRLSTGGFAYLCSTLGFLDLMSGVPGIMHEFLFFALVQPAPILIWVRAAVVLRVFKVERITGGVRQLRNVISGFYPIISTMGAATLFLWLFFSAAMFYSDRKNPVLEVRDNLGSITRALWLEALNLHGEVIVCDFSPVGKAIAAVIMIYVVCIWLIPATCISGVFLATIAHDADGFDKRIEDIGALVKEWRPWETKCRPSEPGWRQSIYDTFYAHLHEKLPAKNRSFRLVRSASLALTGCNVFVSCLITTSTFLPVMCYHDTRCLMYKEVVWTLDWIATCFFSVTLLLRCLAVGWRYPCSLLGVSDILSLFATALTLTPMREVLLHPDYGAGNTGLLDKLDDLVVPMRLIRMHCMVVYAKDRNLLACAICWNKGKLGRALLILVNLWLVHATLLHLIESGHDKRDYQADRYSTSGLTMADRYKDVLSAMHYSLIHLTGDFPIYRYRPASAFVLMVGFVFGMCALASFYGIFTSSFIMLTTHERALEREEQLAYRRLLALRAALKVQRLFRLRRKQREEREAAGAMSPAEAVLSGAAPSSTPYTGLHAGSLRRRLVAIMNRANDTGRKIVLFLNVVLFLDVCSSIMRTLTRTSTSPIFETLHWIQGGVEVLFDIIFVAEYIVRVGPRSMSFMLTPWRLFDLLCLVPGFWRIYLFSMQIVAAKDESGSPWWKAGVKHDDWLYDWFTFLLVCRIIRILDWPAFRRMWFATVNGMTSAVPYLLLPSYLAACTWVYLSAAFMWTEQYYKGEYRHKMDSIPSTMFWTSIFVIGEWPMADFNTTAGSCLCIFTVLLGTAIFAAPFGILVEAANHALQFAVKQDEIDTVSFGDAHVIGVAPNNNAKASNNRASTRKSTVSSGKASMVKGSKTGSKVFS